MRKRILHFTALVLLAAMYINDGAFAPECAYACPNCKNAYDTERGDPTLKDQQSMASAAKGYNYSIYLMMPLPFLLAAAFGGVLYWHMKRNAPSIASDHDTSNNADFPPGD